MSEGCSNQATITRWHQTVTELILSKAEMKCIKLLSSIHQQNLKFNHFPDLNGCSHKSSAITRTRGFNVKVCEVKAYYKTLNYMKSYFLKKP